MKKKLLTTINSVSNSTKAKIVCGSVGVTTFLASTPVFAADGTLNTDVKTALSSGFSTAQSNITEIIVLAIPVSVAIIALVGGAKAGLKWVKGAFAKAA